MPVRNYEIDKMTPSETLALALACMGELDFEQRLEVVRKAFDKDELAELAAQIEG